MHIIYYVSLVQWERAHIFFGVDEEREKEQTV